MSETIQRPETAEDRDRQVSEQYAKVGQDRRLAVRKLFENMQGQIDSTGKITCIQPKGPARLPSDQPQPLMAIAQPGSARTRRARRNHSRKRLQEVPDRFILKTEFGQVVITPSPSAHTEIKASGWQLYKLPIPLTAQAVLQLRELQNRTNTVLTGLNLGRLDYVPGETADSIRAMIKKYPGANLWSVDRWAHQVLQGETSLFDPNSAAPADSGNILAIAWLALEQCAREEAVVNNVLRLFLDAVTAFETVADLHPEWDPRYKARSTARTAFDHEKARPESGEKLEELEQQYTSASQACYRIETPLLVHLRCAIDLFLRAQKSAQNATSK